MDTNKNLYTVIYSTVLVVVVAVVLALASYLLKDKQERNVEIETKQMVLKSVHLGTDAGTVADKAKYIEDLYTKYIKDTTIQDGDITLQLYICTLDSKDKLYILPVHGTGLWGPIWGYVALKSDLNTIYGTTFEHKGETPGLGAEINTPAFSKQFEGKQIFENGKFVSILVVKGGADPTAVNQVDAISGGTITSKAVEAMLLNNLTEYLNFFKANLKEPVPVVAASDSTMTVPADTTKAAIQTPIK
jgi:Na+-transporting NADH:ubiquinone oxidoreductase subunit C